MNRNNLILLWLLLLFFPVDILAQSHMLALNPTKSLTQYDHEVWQTENGLPQNSVTAILQTTDGYLWIGTYDGICRFDGRDFTTINAFNHSVLENADINTIFESHNHALWIGTRGDGLAYFKNNHLKIYTIKNGLPSNDISCIGQTSDGTIWIGTYDGGIASFKNNHFTVYPKTYSLHSKYIVCLYINPKGTVWFGTNGSGIIKYEKGKFSRITYKNGLSNDHIRDITEDSKGRLWIATSGGGITVFGKKSHFYIKKKKVLPVM